MPRPSAPPGSRAASPRLQQTGPDAPSPPADGYAELPGETWGWTRRQRVALAVLLAAFGVVLLTLFILRPARVDDPVVIYNGAAVRLPERIDPNTATSEELARIPHVGDKLAAAIIAWREERKALTPDGIVFRSESDLGHIRGIGKAVRAQIRPYLRFPDDAVLPPAADAAASQPLP